MKFHFVKDFTMSVYYGGQKISAVIFPSFQKNRCSPFLIVIMIDVFTCHFWKSSKMPSVSNCTINFFYYLEYENVNNMFMHRNKKKKLKNNVFFLIKQSH
jgi:hypothetical protein